MQGTKVPQHGHMSAYNEPNELKEMCLYQERSSCETVHVGHIRHQCTLSGSHEGQQCNVIPCSRPHANVIWKQCPFNSTTMSETESALPTIKPQTDFRDTFPASEHWCATFNPVWLIKIGWDASKAPLEPFKPLSWLWLCRTPPLPPLPTPLPSHTSPLLHISSPAASSQKHKIKSL